MLTRILQSLKKNIIPVLIVITVYLVVSRIFGYSCPLRLLTGISCPGCGMTRAWRALFAGHLKEAFYYHPLFLLPIPVMLVFMLRDSMPSRIADTILIIFGIIFITVYVIRLTGGSPVVNRDIHEGMIWKVLEFFGRIIGKTG